MNSDYWEQIEIFLQQHIAHFGNRMFVAPLPERVNYVPASVEISSSNALPQQDNVGDVQQKPEPNKAVDVKKNIIHDVQQPIQQATMDKTPSQPIIEQKQNIVSTVEPWKNTQSLTELFSCIHTCKECKLGETRNNFVFGVGNPNADIMVVGEAPGADEDAQGEPFVGRAGQLLTKILAAINLSRSDVYIANIIKCRPPGNRVPEKDEVAQCEPYLHKQIELIKPKFILALGLTAANTLLKSKFKMSEVRGKTFEYHGATMIITYHPAALLRNPEWKRGTWEDVQKLRDMWLATLPK